MRKWIVFTGLCLLLSFVVGSSCNQQVVRDAAVYKNEVNFMEQVMSQSAAQLAEWIETSCKCEVGKFTSTLCEQSAKKVQLVRSRMPWHKAMMLYNAGLLDKRPSKKPPTIPPANALCPGGGTP